MLVTYKKIDIDEIWGWQIETMETMETNHNQSKCWVVKPSSNTYIYKRTPTPEAQGTLQKRRWRDCKSQRMREFAIKLCLLIMSEVAPIKSHPHDGLNMSWKWQWTCQSGRGGGEGWGVGGGTWTVRPQPHTKIHRQLRKAESRRTHQLVMFSYTYIWKRARPGMWRV